ncbi:MAG: Archaeal aspartate aminotransferase or a related aminotransferase [Candidatus Alkanophagales archaeon MCA70_species_1]|nr:Archaeal aspartate aminotransferase or a related aminotransferase [Candidatus Alkanophaga volatiphilum]
MEPSRVENELVMLPGPVTVSPRILRALSKPIINHRGEEFAALYRECVELLKYVFQTRNDVFVLSGSGTCAMEAAVGNVLGIGQGGKAITIVNGKFGERLKDIADRYGVAVPVEFEWGLPIDLEAVKSVLEEEEDVRTVTMVHNETSVGMLNPAREIGKLARKHDALFILDCITSIGGIDVPVDKIGVDIAIVGSQKCLGMPPGLSAVSVSERAWEVIEENGKKVPYYMDLKAYRESFEKGQTPYTPALPLFFALREALEIIKEEGLENRIKRHKSMAEAVRAAVLSLGLKLFPKLNEFSEYSNTVTAVCMPNGITDAQLRGDMKRLGIVIAGGQERLKGKIFRIATMGNISARDVLTVIQALEIVLAKYNVIEGVGAGVEAARKALGL